jgi:hypothetical protein
MAGEFPDVNAERYNKRAKTAAENSAALKWKNGLGVVSRGPAHRRGLQVRERA